MGSSKHNLVWIERLYEFNTNFQLLLEMLLTLFKLTMLQLGLLMNNGIMFSLVCLFLSAYLFDTALYLFVLVHYCCIFAGWVVQP